MPFIAFALLIISLIKLILIASFNNNLEIKELIYNTPISVNTPPILIYALITIDGLIGLICSVYLLTTGLW